MIEWTPYPDPSVGSHAKYRGVILVAEHSGAWAVFDEDGNRGVVTSSLAPILYPPAERNIESAKAKAEAAAIKMLS